MDASDDEVSDQSTHSDAELAENEQSEPSSPVNVEAGIKNFTDAEVSSSMGSTSAISLRSVLVVPS